MKIPRTSAVSANGWSIRSWLCQGWVRHIDSIEAFRYITMLLLLRRSDLSIISVWHPSFLEQTDGCVRTALQRSDH